LSEGEASKVTGLSASRESHDRDVVRGVDAGVDEERLSG
jgi:hypothetical protein